MFCMLFVSVGCNGHDTILVYGPSIFTHLHLSLTSVQMATISWLGFTTGYALASPLTVLIPGVSTLIARYIPFFCKLFQKLPRKTEWHRSRKYRLRESVLFSSRLSVTRLKIAKNHLTQKSTNLDLAHLLD